MALKFRVKSLDEVPEAHRDLYTEVEGGFQLDAEGIDTKDTSKLESALERLKREKRELKERLDARTDLSADDAEELERLRSERAAAEEAKAREAGKFDELRAKWQEKHDKEIQALKSQVDRAHEAVKKLTVTNELRSAIAKAGIKPEYHDAVEALLSRQGPTVEWQEGKDPVGVFLDEVEGNRPIGDYVGEWAKSDAASPYMPPENGGGGGGTGTEGRRGGGKQSYDGKKFSDMTTEEQVAYTNEKYGSGAAA